MNKHKNKKSRFARNSKIAIAATMLSVPMLANPTNVFAQENNQKKSAVMGKTESSETVHLYLKYSAQFIKIHETYSIAGLDNGHTIYKNSKGEYFYIDPPTGDMKFLSTDYYLKFTTQPSAAKGHYIKYLKFEDTDKRGLTFGREKLKGTSKTMGDFNLRVSILGVDSNGNVVQKNSKGEKFFLDPTTGDMVQVK